MIAGIAKAYPGWTPEYILHELTYANLMLYSAVLPDPEYKKKSEGVNGYDASTDANNPENFGPETEEIIIRR